MLRRLRELQRAVAGGAMQRRRFLETCAAVSGVAALDALTGAWAAAPQRAYDRVRLVDTFGAPVRAAALAPETNFVFQYPFAATPCFLLNLGRPVAAPAVLARADGSSYGWGGGAGPARSIVAFSAICAHKLAYPTRDISFIRYQPQRSPTSDAHVIHCCADHSVYDPAQGARVVAGPAPQPLAAIVLDYDATKDELYATGTAGTEQFDKFFTKYEFKLALEYGDKARARVTGATVVRELTEYCRQTIRC
jgi:Rieske Fe-S protein